MRCCFVSQGNFTSCLTGSTRTTTTESTNLLVH